MAAKEKSTSCKEYDTLYLLVYYCLFAVDVDLREE